MKKIIKQLILIGILLVVFGILMIFRTSAPLADFFVRYISTNYMLVCNVLFSWLPWTIYELTIAFAVFFILYLLIDIIKNLFKKEWLESLNKFLTIIIFGATCLNMYMFSASMAYGRSPAPVPQYSGEVNQELHENMIEYFLNDYNFCSSQLEYDEEGFVISPYTFKEINELLKESYKKLDSSYYNPYSANGKTLMTSDLFSELKFTGINWAPSGETMINDNISFTELPHTLAHEMAHNKGIYREDEANLVALYICITSDNDFIRYAGYYAGFNSLLTIYYQTNYDKYVETYFSLAENIRNEYSAINKYWSERIDIIGKIGQWYNDLFLKLNGNIDGTDDYLDKGDSEDSGTTDENNHPIYIINEYSPYQKVFIQEYLSKNELN
jgi:hypothetical protein